MFNASMAPQPARELFDEFVAMTRKMYIAEKVQTGRFGALMEVALVNHGPVTIIFDSPASGNNNKAEELDD